MKIEKDVPLPSPGCGRPRSELEIPFDEMEIGDSVLVQKSSSKSANLESLVKVRALRHGNATGRKYTSRKQSNGIRVWRIA